MAKVIFRQKAINDLNSIWYYTFEKWSEKQADNYYNTIKITCIKIEDNLNFCKRYDEVSKNLFGLTCGKHIIFFKQLSVDKIEIIRILHVRMDLKRRLAE